MFNHIIKIYSKSIILLVFFFTSITNADQVSDKPRKIAPLPGYFEEVNNLISLNQTNVFYNQYFETRSFEAFENRFLIIHFWASWCMECTNELVALNELQRSFKKKALTVIAISEDFKGPESVDKFFKKNKIDYLDIYIDKKNKIYQSLNINHLPATYLMDFNGDIIARSRPSEGISWSDPEIVRFLDDKVMNIQLLPPEYKQLRDIYEAPPVQEKKETTKKEKLIKKEKSKIFIN